MSLPRIHDWVYTRGDTLSLTVVYATSSEPVVDAGEWRVRMQVRRDVDADPWLTKTDGDGITVTVDGGALRAVIAIDPEDTRDWSRARFKGVYDVEVTSPLGVVRTVVRGRFDTPGDVTKVPA